MYRRDPVSAPPQRASLLSRRVPQADPDTQAAIFGVRLSPTSCARASASFRERERASHSRRPSNLTNTGRERKPPGAMILKQPACPAGRILGQREKTKQCLPCAFFLSPSAFRLPTPAVVPCLNKEVTRCIVSA